MQEEKKVEMEEQEEDVYVEMVDTYYYNPSPLKHEAMSVVAFKLIE